MKKITFIAALSFFTISLFSQKLPYPIIFIHGLNSDSNVWYDTWTNPHMSTNKIGNFLINNNLTFGGRIDFCLNDDNDNTKANKNFWPVPNADISLFTDVNTEMAVGDFYLINFDNDNQGRKSGELNFDEMLSNEAAIVKQGVALKTAIAMVLNKTGRDKVILMGHSMGGLCAREYLQNPSNWQSDGQHHIAKLITTGTPHGGYQGIDISLPGDPINWQSEAYRDLRYSYLISGDDGVYLYGGLESHAVMNNNLSTNFYNVDVNCNGIVGDNIIGLNEKYLYLNLDFAYIIGICDGCFASEEGDGVVRAVNANLNNFYDLPTPRNEFIYNGSSAIQIHTDMPLQILHDMQGLDEPNEYNLAYRIDYNKVYRGFITQQPVGGYPYDYDDYKFTTSGGPINIVADNSYSQTLNVRIVNTTNNAMATGSIAASSAGNLSTTLAAGEYYLEFYTTASTTSYNFPYTFSISNSLEVENMDKPTIVVYPNPAINMVNVDYDGQIESIEVYSLLGQKVLSQSGSDSTMDISSLSTGHYLMKVKTDSGEFSERIMKE